MPHIGPKTSGELLAHDAASFLPPAFLIFAGAGLDLRRLGHADRGRRHRLSRRAGAGAWNRRLNLKMLKEVIESSALTNALVFFIIFGATLFSFVFRALGGDDVVVEILKALGIDTGWEILIFVMAAGVRHGILLRLDRDLPDRAADLRADPEEDRLRPASAATSK